MIVVEFTSSFYVCLYSFEERYASSNSKSKTVFRFLRLGHQIVMTWTPHEFTIRVVWLMRKHNVYLPV
jgi:hypothetical protein